MDGGRLTAEEITLRMKNSYRKYMKTLRYWQENCRPLENLCPIHAIKFGKKLQNTEMKT
jgi:hypothetical protein